MFKQYINMDNNELCALGYKYYQEQNYPKAIEFWLKAANRDCAIAQYNLGLMYLENDRGVNQNYLEASKWFKKAADNGDPDALYNLGIMYDNGEGVSQDYNEAFDCFKQVAEQYDDADAECALGIMYYYGQGVRKNKAKAVKYYELAASQGHTEARDRLDTMRRNKSPSLKFFAPPNPKFLI
jgi:hypothetical protein